ncbi:unnamed protein product [Prunus armeniaca]|uniref:Uncharacterized protein n=1 Tax=Prunus armeniaca TaxID=36596 RepID=A0A6J5WYM2_PRUAR|nr:hypothetical protein GBA52_011518 [Prunus armeniaca]CAB4305097.1 unnamed protein product [Prunus armeniaca]
MAWDSFRVVKVEFEVLKHYFHPLVSRDCSVLLILIEDLGNTAMDEFQHEEEYAQEKRFSLVV